MIYGYARVSTDGQNVEAQVVALTAAGAGKVFQEVASGAKTDRAQLRRALDALDVGDVLMVSGSTGWPGQPVISSTLWRRSPARGLISAPWEMGGRTRPRRMVASCWPCSGASRNSNVI